MTLPKRVSLGEKFEHITEHWSPKIVGALNGQHVKVATLLGEFCWHAHEHEDEMFLVVSGTLVIEFRDGEVSLGPGEFTIVPRGVEHRPVAREEVRVVLFEPEATLNTGDQQNALTVDPDWL